MDWWRWLLWPLAAHAAEVPSEDVQYSPLGDGVAIDASACTSSWRAAGLGDRIAAVHENALPTEWVQEILDAVPLIEHRWIINHVGSSDSGRNTWWLPMFDASGSRMAPQSTIEAAVHHLYDLDFGDASPPIIGAEWWIRSVGIDSESPDFHVDKDESRLPALGVFRMPDVATVTYLTPAGAPTLVLNQTMGSPASMAPAVAAEGVLVHPHLNKHLLFRGNLLHGVLGDLAPSALGAMPQGLETDRVTLLINFWRGPAPMAPECLPFVSASWRRLGLFRDFGDVTHTHTHDACANAPADASSQVDTQRSTAAAAAVATAAAAAVEHTQRSTAAAAAAATAAAAVELPMETATDDDATRVAIVAGLAHIFYLHFPSRRVLAQRFSEGHVTAHIRWQSGAAFGPLTIVNRQSLEAIDADPRPKLMLVIPPHAPMDWRGDLPLWLPRLQEGYSERLHLLLVDPYDRETRGALAFVWEQVDLRTAGLPTAVIHDHGEDGALSPLLEPFSEATVSRLVWGFLDHRNLSK